MPISSTLTSTGRISHKCVDKNLRRAILLKITPTPRFAHRCASVQQQQEVLTESDDDEFTQQQQANLDALKRVFTPLEVDKLVSSKPSVVNLPAADWLRFFEGYGLNKTSMWKSLRYSAHKLSDPYTAGTAIRWLKQLGPWTDADVADRLLPCYPEVLAVSEEQLQSLQDHLMGLGFSRDDVQQLLWECPGLISSYREKLMPLITRMIESRRNKYTNGGSYVD